MSVTSDSEQRALRVRVLRGLDEHLLSRQLWGIRRVYRDRANAELGEIDSRGLTPFFAAATKLSDTLRGKGLGCQLCPGKASGSLVMLALGLSRVDPIALKLYFEPFIFGTITAPSMAFAISPGAMDTAQELLGSVAGGRFVVLDTQGCVAWGAFPSSCLEPVAYRGIARRFRFPTIVLVPSEEAAAPHALPHHIQPTNLEDVAQQLILEETVGRTPISDQPTSPECLADILAPTRGALIYYEQLWEILEVEFNQDPALAGRTTSALRRGGDSAKTARADLLRRPNRLWPAALRAAVVDYVQNRAPYLVSRSYFVSAALNEGPSRDTNGAASALHPSG